MEYEKKRKGLRLTPGMARPWPGETTAVPRIYIRDEELGTLVTLTPEAARELGKDLLMFAALSEEAPPPAPPTEVKQ
jgi:hypothetical protein